MRLLLRNYIRELHSEFNDEVFGAVSASVKIFFSGAADPFDMAWVLAVF